MVFQFRDAQQPAKTRHQRVGFGDGVIEFYRVGRVFLGLLLDAVKLGAQASKRGAQVVGDVVAHALDLVHQFFDAVEHGIDDGGEHVQLVAPVGQRQPVREVAGDDGLGAGLDPANAPQRAAAQQVPAGSARNDGQGQRPQQGVPDNPRYPEQRAVGAYQHQPAAVFGVGGHGVAAVLGQFGVIGLHAIGQGVDLAIQRQVGWYGTDRPAQGAKLLIEQAIGVHALHVEGHAGGQRFHQFFAVETLEKMLALQQGMARQVAEVA
ncbi:hypothetical protein PFLmoz3_00657 [Pseudomonas fluorescens]|uniref:Uncharacterized protein n=1 Tax=Pseudomonas fluorescens TaxID=294 RepID=A0A109LLR3_PSEFL|nr:hypothetical protein PFLmoz3_00657 [Pseudomonas fluorescens]